MDKKPEALQLADALMKMSRHPNVRLNPTDSEIQKAAAAELRQLYKANKAYSEFLSKAMYTAEAHKKDQS